MTILTKDQINKAINEGVAHGVAYVVAEDYRISHRADSDTKLARAIRRESWDYTVGDKAKMACFVAHAPDGANDAEYAKVLQHLSGKTVTTLFPSLSM